MFRSASLAVLAFAMTAATPAFANNIPLFNTGVDDAGNTLVNGAIDTHYTLEGWGAPRTATSANGYPIGPWLGDDASSDWIGPNTDAALDAPEGYYYYQYSFSLDGLKASTAAITGRWSSDDEGFDIVLNGVSSYAYADNLGAWFDFNITSGFVSGMNTLEFRTYNSGGPTGLRVEMTGTAAVPEPASWAMMLGGFGLVGGAMRSRRKAAVTYA